jgi:prolyl oligopeptidase
MLRKLTIAFTLIAFLPCSLVAQEKSLAARILPLAKAHHGKVAVAVKHLDSGESYYLDEDEEMPTASLIKFMIMLEVYLQVSEGKVKLDDRLTLRKADMVPGSGILTYHFSDGATFSLRDATRLMIVFSDNTATNMVLDHIGLASTNKRLDSWGFPHTKLNAKVFLGGKTSLDPARTKKFGLGSTTARETVLLLEKVHQGKVVSPEICKEMLGHMKKCDDKLKLKRYLPDGLVIAHKSGTVSDARTDAGIMYLPQGPVAICVLTAQNEDKSFKDDNAGNVVIGRIAEQVRDYFALAKARVSPLPSGGEGPGVRGPALPETPKKPVTDVYHGAKVIDDYRWLEKADDPVVRKWLEAQNRVTRAAIDASPSRLPLRKQLDSNQGDPAPRYGYLQASGGKLFALSYQPPKEQPMLVVMKSADEPGSAKALVDLNTIDPTGKTAIDFYTPSRDGKLVAVSLSEGGSEEGTLYVYDVATGQRLKDVLPRVSFPTAGGCIAWNADNSGFFYTRYPRGAEKAKDDLNFYQQVYFHKLGTTMDADTYVFGKDLPRIAEIFLDASSDGKYLLATVQKGDGGEFEHFLRDPTGKWKRLTGYSDKVNAVAFGHGGDRSIYLLSRKEAPKGALHRWKLDTQEPDRPVSTNSDIALVGLQWPAGVSRMVPNVVPTANGLFALAIDGGPSQLIYYARDGKLTTKVPLPKVSAVSEFLHVGGDEILLNLTTFTEPAAWYAYKKGDAVIRKSPLSSKSPGHTDINVVRLTATSKDGTKVPMTVMYRKGIKYDGTNPTLLTGYGGYGISLSPSFDASRRVWFDHGGVLAIANIRGGGEFGEAWHKGAILTKRQNAYDDFAACARHLIDNKYTSKDKLAIEGGSNGGLLVGVMLTQHPNLFRAVVAHVGVHDMLRAELHPNGAFNVPEYGSVKVPDQFKALHAYSPYHNVRDGTAYPAVLLLTGANDNRVDPSHSFKMAARLQSATSSKHPILLRVSFDTGHGLGESATSRLDRAADVHTFLFDQLGMKARP